MKKILLISAFSLTTILTYAQNKSNATSVQGMLQGKWQSVDDKTNVIMFDQNERKESSDGMKTWDKEVFILSDKCSNESDQNNGMKLEKDKYISCKESDLCWYIVLINKDLLTLTYMGRGNTLKYKRVK
jgi:small nuclear ribonucleoprotein (snRNP)-like protein